MDCLPDENEQVVEAESGAFEQTSSCSEIEALYRYFSISPTEPHDHRINALHVYGVSEMSTEDVRQFFADFEPFRLEWIDDVSCNVVFESEEKAARCIMAVAAPPEKEDVSSFSGETWWLANDRPGGQQLLIRFARTRDVKMSKAYLRSQYFRLHGNPRLGGIRGFISKAVKREVMKDPSLLEKIKRMEDEAREGKSRLGDQKRAENVGGKMPKRSHDSRVRLYSVEEHKATRRAKKDEAEEDLRHWLETKRSLS